MAAIASTITKDKLNPGVRYVVWEGLVKGDTGESDESGSPLGMSSFADRSVQVTGTFDSATVTIEGSNDGTTWATLSDQVGDDLSFTAAGIAMVAELTRYIRPAVSDSGGSADIDVTMLVRSSSQRLQ